MRLINSNTREVNLIAHPNQLIYFTVVAMSSAETFDTNFVELDAAKMITTGDSNYAILNPNFAFNWRR